MKSSRTLKHILSLAFLFFVGMALQFAGCSAPSTTGVKTMPQLSSYILPSTLSTFDVGQIHNAAELYILSHYDTLKYAGFTHYFSETGIDSLFALFVTDSLQSATGPLSQTQINQATATFDSSFHACLTEPASTHSNLISSIDSGEAHGFLASDEANFIIKADSQLGFCTSFTELNDTITSLRSQYNSTVWQTSTSHGYLAYEYLSMANGSCHFWGGANGNGGSGDPFPPVMLREDPMGFTDGFDSGAFLTGDPMYSLLNGIANGVSASLGGGVVVYGGSGDYGGSPTGQIITAIIVYIISLFL